MSVMTNESSDTRNLDAFLAPATYIDSEAPEVVAFARDRAGSGDVRDRAVRLYYAVRDEFPYDPYSLDDDPAHFKASHVLAEGRGYCVPKATLLAAVCRAAGIPARPGFADVRNHLATKRLLEMTGSDLFIYHGYVEVLLDGRWVKCTPAFNLSLCEKFGVLPLEFDGYEDSLFHPFDARGQRHMEYVRDHGTFADTPAAEIIEAFRSRYPRLIAFAKERRRADFAKEAEIENAAGAA